MVAAAIVVIAMAGMIAVLTQTAPLSTISAHDCLAMNAVRMKMEMIRATPFGDLVNTFKDQDFAVVGLRAARGDGDGLPGEVTIDDSDPEFLTITVRVAWDGPGGKALSYESATLRYQGGG